MSAAATAVATTADKKTSASLSVQLADLRPELEKVLPAHVTVDKFLRVVNTSISQNPDLYKADRRSLFTSCVKCATDGLVPDGREAALVIFNTKEKVMEGDKQVERWIKKAQYMPMIFGILKKIRNSGELKSLTCNVVMENDTFRYWIDDAGEHITHEPNVKDADRGKFLCTYAIAKTNDGGVYTEVMTRGQIEQVRAASKSKDGPAWKEWFDEMARKSVLRRLSKRLPMSTDIERVIKRVDDDYDFRARTVHANSGADATKQLLGIVDASAHGESAVETIEDGGMVDVPDDNESIAAIKSMGSAKDLEQCWSGLIVDYDKAGVSIPNEVDFAYKTQKEKLAKF